METFSNENLVKHELNKFYIIGMGRMGRNFNKLVNAYSRSHVFRCVLLNLESEVQYNQNMWAMEDIQFNMDTDHERIRLTNDEKGVIVKCQRFIPVKKPMSGGVTTSTGTRATFQPKRKKPNSQDNSKQSQSPEAGPSKRSKAIEKSPFLYSSVKQVLLKEKDTIIAEDKTSVLGEVRKILEKYKNCQQVKLWTDIDEVLKSSKTNEDKFNAIVCIIFYVYADYEKDSLDENKEKNIIRKSIRRKSNNDLIKGQESIEKFCTPTRKS